MKINESFKTDDYYKESTIDDFNKSRIVSFSNMWIKMMKGWNFNPIIEETRGKKWIHDSDEKFYMFETQDQYFWYFSPIEDPTDIYRCDQIDGVERLLRDKNII